MLDNFSVVKEADNEINSNNKHDSLFDKLSLVIISSFFFLLLGIQFGETYGPIGESVSYIMATVAFENHPLSQRILPTDIEHAKIEFPEHSWNFDVYGFYTSQDGGRYPWYFPTYSISVIPAKTILNVFDMAAIRTYPISNIMFYTIALIVVYFFLKASRKTVFITILLLIFSPSILYYSWPSAEMFICSILIITLVFWLNGNKHIAVLFCSIVSTLNITINAICLAIIIDYLLDVYYKRGISIRVLVRQNWRNTALFVACCIPSLFMPLFNLRISGTINLQNTLFSVSDIMSDMNTYDSWLGRFFAYITDLNFGFLPYFPVLLLLLFVTYFIAIYKKNRKVVITISGFILVVFLYSAIPHINCGMTGIARYDAWSAPFLAFSATILLPSLILSVKKQNSVSWICIASAIISTMTVYSSMRYTRGSYTMFSPIAKYVLEHMPVLYNPLPSTFANRTRHIDGAYGYIDSEEPTIYFSDDGYAKKILIPRAATLNEVMSRIDGKEQALSEIQNKIENAKIRNNRYVFINVYDEITRAAELYCFDPLDYDERWTYLSFGVYPWETTFHWFSPNAKIWLKPGDLQKTGLELAFNTAPFLRPFVLGDTLSTKIYIDGVLVETVILPDVDYSPNVVYIDGTKLPIPESNTYTIDIITNGAFNPSKASFTEGYNPNDKRDLTIAVTYIGPIRQ